MDRQAQGAFRGHKKWIEVAAKFVLFLVIFSLKMLRLLNSLLAPSLTPHHSDGSWWIFLFPTRLGSSQYPVPPVPTLRNNSWAAPWEKLGQRDGQPGRGYSQLEGTSGGSVALAMNSLISHRDNSRTWRETEESA